MSRWSGSPALNEQAAAQPAVILVMFAKLQFPGSPDPTVYLHDGIGTLTWGGKDWQGLGQFGGIDSIPEELDSIAIPVRLTLSGVESQYVTSAMETQYSGSPVTLYVGIVDTSTYVLVDDPEIVWSGYMDVMVIEMAQGSAQITMNCENVLRKGGSSARYTDEDQQMRYSGDKFFEFLHRTTDTGKWGVRDVRAVRNVLTGGGTRGPRGVRRSST